MLQLEDGSLAQSPEQVAKRRQRYFAEQMSGAQSRLRRAELGETLALRVPPPSQDQIVDMLLSINTVQAIGEDSLPACVGRACPQAFARILSHAIVPDAIVPGDVLSWSVAAAMERRECGLVAQTAPISTALQVKSRHPCQ